MSSQTWPPPYTVLPDDEIQRVLVVQAHPDDVDFGSAGTVANWTDAGISVTYCICTDGQAGGFDLDLPRSEIPRIRREEQRLAARTVGVEDVRFLGYVDGELQVDRPLLIDLVRVIRDVRPDRVLTASPDRNWRALPASHPDHLAAGEATTQAVYPFARNPFAYPELLDEGLEPWTVRELWLGGHHTDNHAVDVTEQFERKLTALHAHTSQHPEPEGLRKLEQEWMSGNARAHGLPEGRLAESFAVVPAG